MVRFRVPSGKFQSKFTLPRGPFMVSGPHKTHTHTESLPYERPVIYEVLIM